MEILTAEKVTTIFNDCLFRDDENTDNHIKAEGIMTNVGFHPDRLKGYQGNIIAMLKELPDGFMKSKGGGWSFLQACNDRHGHQWTGLHQTMEQLFLLGIGINRVKSQLPKEIWSVLPGGMPYYVIIDTPERSA